MASLPTLEHDSSLFVGGTRLRPVRRCTASHPSAPGSLRWRREIGVNCSHFTDEQAEAWQVKPFVHLMIPHHCKHHCESFEIPQITAWDLDQAGPSGSVSSSVL